MFMIMILRTSRQTDMVITIYVDLARAMSKYMTESEAKIPVPHPFRGAQVIITM